MRRALLIRAFTAFGLAGCGTDSIPVEPELARRGGAGVTVRSTQPNAAPRGTTLDVHVFGSGFDEGSRATWALNRDTTFATTRIRTNSTTFVSSTELLANITIEADAAVDLHDVVVVTLGGKKGIGLELFAVTFEVIDLGAGTSSWAYAVNDAGQVVGNTAAGRAFLWQNGIRTELNVPVGTASSFAYDVNQQGDIVGETCDAQFRCRAARWTGGVPTELAPPASYCCSAAYAINDVGEVVGWVSVTGAERHAGYWASGATVATDIQLPRTGESLAEDINNHGMIVGYYRLVPGVPGNAGSVVWPAGGGALEFLGAVQDQGGASGINDAGQIVGWGGPTGSPDIGTFPLIAYVWQNGAREYIGTLGGRSSVAMDVTEDGLVVGRTDTGVRRRGVLEAVAFLWSAESGMRGLELVPGLAFSWGLDVSANGWVAGVTGPDGGSPEATLWKPQ